METSTERQTKMEGQKVQKDSHSVKVWHQTSPTLCWWSKPTWEQFSRTKKRPFTLLVCTISIKIYQQISSIQTFQCSPARTCECRGQTETAEVREIGVSVETIREDLWEQKDEDRSSSGMIRRWAAGGRENLLKTSCQRVRGNIPLPSRPEHEAARGERSGPVTQQNKSD